MQNLKVLHIATDNKFLDYALPLFSAIEGVSNSVWIISNTSSLKYTKAKVDQIIDVKQLSSDEAAQFSVLVLHSYRDTLAQFLLKLPDRVRILWIGWGFDYYDLFPVEIKSLLQPLTANFEEQRLRQKSYIHRLIRYIRELNNKSRLPRKENAIRRIDYFAPVLQREYQALKDARPDLSLPKLISWNYGTIEDQYALNLGDGWITGKDILIGNSATLTSNHLDALAILSAVGVSKDQRIHIPLNYGDAPHEYSLCVSARSKQLFGDQSMPITKFMTLESYLQVLCQCGFVIMNHMRQQALGNIITMLYLGARIFLHEDSPVYLELCDCGFNLNRTADLKPGSTWLRTPLTHEERTNNRKLAMERWGRESALKRTKIMIDMLVKQ